MQKTSTNTSPLDNIYLEREPVPGTETLQARILELSAGLPQEDVGPHPARSNIAWLPAFFGIAASLLLVTFLWLPYSGMSVLPGNEKIAQGSYESLNLVELEFQEIMLLQDEMLFDQLAL